MIANPICSNKSGSGNSFKVPTPFEVATYWTHAADPFDGLIGELGNEDDAYKIWERADPENFMVAIIIDREDEIEAIRYATFGDYDYTSLIAPVQLYNIDGTSLVEFTFFKDGNISAHVLIRETGDTESIARPCFYIKRK